ncbi:MAG: response regulator [Defluviitaleaceae bacterium]|nr:response regulator [Defluviitaleaceae bacterium]
MEKNRETIVMVDDDITNLNVARNNLADKYNVFTAPSGEKLFMLLKRITPDLIVLDIEMPEMDGYKVMEKLKQDERTANIPVIFLTAKINPENEIAGLGMGAVDYINKPSSKELLIKRIDLHLLMEKQKKDLHRYNMSLEIEVNKKTKTILELQNAILKTVAELVECRDNITGGHIERTQHYLRLLVDFLLEHGVYSDELSKWDIDLFIMSSQLHDVGKISVKDDILMKADKLTATEFDLMKKHALYGANIIRKIENNTSDNSFLQNAEVLAGTHHEKWNGNGYPFGLKGDEIPLQGRLMAIVDVYDALTNERPYKKAYSHEHSMEIIKNERGSQFDPHVVDIFLTHEKEFKKDAIIRKIGDIGSDNFRPALKTIAHEISMHGGVEKSRAERIGNYLSIFFDALIENDRFRAEIFSWDKEIFLLSAQFHDIGKQNTYDIILNESGEYVADEVSSVTTHIEFGIKIIRQIKDCIEDGSLMYHAEAMTGSHHEKWDGTGFPHGLKGSGIPLQGRIMAIIDVYDALTANRPNKIKKTHRETINIIKNCTGTHFDPDLVDVLVINEAEFDEERRKWNG